MSTSHSSLTADSNPPLSRTHEDDAVAAPQRCSTPDRLGNGTAYLGSTIQLPERNTQNSQPPSETLPSNVSDEILALPNGNGGHLHRNVGQPSPPRGAPLRKATLPKSDNDVAWERSFMMSFDGGGVRGLSTLFILRRLMQHIKRIEKLIDPATKTSFHPSERPPLENGNDSAPPSQNSSRHENDDKCTSGFFPCHYLDYMAGTSTGGLIAIMLSRLRMDVDDTIAEFIKLAGHIFGKPRLFSIRGPILWPRPKHNHKHLESAFGKLLEERIPNLRHDIGSRQFPSNQDMCRTMVIAYAKRESGSEDAYIFRSYDHTTTFPESVCIRNPGKANAVNISQVGRATSAAPTYFKPVEIDDRKLGDGGLGCNNPSLEAYREVKDMHNGDPSGVALLVSIGTGENPITRFAKAGGLSEYVHLIGVLKGLATDTHKVDENLRDIMTARNTYFRFNVDARLRKVKMDSWKRDKGSKPSTAVEIERLTDEYLETSGVDANLAIVAQILVENRRRRATTLRWTERMFGFKYRCGVKNCHEGPKVRTRTGLERHLQQEHYGFEEDQTEETRREYNEMLKMGSHIEN